MASLTYYHVFVQRSAEWHLIGPGASPHPGIQAADPMAKQENCKIHHNLL